MIKRLFYLFLLMATFGLGVYIWKISHTGYNLAEVEEEAKSPKKIELGDVLAYVGDVPITAQDLELEFSIHIRGLTDTKDLTAIPEVGDKAELQLAPLRERILAQMIERKVLYKHASDDQKFDMADSSRYVSCLTEWHVAIDNGAANTASILDRERLKTRLCETQILKQYMDEIIFSKISIKDEDISEYFKNHQGDFVHPERVTIRQIVLATEEEANAVKAKLTKSNFEELAREHSIAFEREKGGLLGPFSQQEMPRIFDIAFTMNPGDVKGVLKSNYGFHIIKLERKYPKTKLNRAAAIPKIREILEKRKKEEEYNKWVETALNTIPVRGP